MSEVASVPSVRLCSRCGKVLPAQHVREYTSRRADLLIERGLCICLAGGSIEVLSPAVRQMYVDLSLGLDDTNPGRSPEEIVAETQPVAPVSTGNTIEGKVVTGEQVRQAVLGGEVPEITWGPKPPRSTRPVPVRRQPKRTTRKGRKN